MHGKEPHVYGIGNPLIDIIAEVDDSDLQALGIHKGAMHLIDQKRRGELLAYIAAKRLSYACGGSCPNTIITLASLGITATLAGKIGSDEYGNMYRKRLKQLQVIDELVCSDEPTGSSIILMTADSERTMNTFLGANRFFSSEDVNLASLKKAQFFHFTGYMWDTKAQQSSIHKALEITKETKAVVSFDIADPFVVGRNQKEFLELIANHANIVFANSEEARILFDNYDPLECCKSMGKLCQTAIVKHGKNGSYISHNQQLFKVSVQGPVPPLDTTGAGDVSAAGFLWALAHSLPIEKAGEVASFLAGEIVKQRGAQFSLSKAEELRQQLRTRYLI